MDILSKLKTRGWFISEEGLDVLCGTSCITDVNDIIKRALNTDIREYGSPVLPENINKMKLRHISGNCVLQIQKLKNVTAPKHNQSSSIAPRMLKICLTDGHSACYAIEIEHISHVDCDTPPGTKVYIKTDLLPIESSFLLLRPSYIDVLGGKVNHLIEKWDLAKRLANHNRTLALGDRAPPPWIPFGQKCLHIFQDTAFKSLTQLKSNPNQATEFDSQRRDAIVKATQEGQTKKFGGGSVLLDHTLQMIVERGYTVQEAERALKKCKNDPQKALGFLQRGDSFRRRPATAQTSRRKGREQPSDGIPVKPMEKVSLFEFIENKFPKKESDIHRGPNNQQIFSERVAIDVTECSSGEKSKHQRVRNKRYTS